MIAGSSVCIGFSVPPSVVPTHNLTIVFKHLKPSWYGKYIQIGYWNEHTSDFPSDNADYVASFKLSRTQNSVTKSLPEGVYAVACFVDENGNGKIDKNWLGIPSEPYCFSANYKPVLSAPDFEDCDLILDNNRTLTLNMLD